MERTAQAKEIIGLYEDHNLTPLFITLGGSRSFNHNDGNLDYDYFGFHKERRNKEVQVRMVLDDDRVVKSMSQHNIRKMLSREDSLLASLIVTTLLWHDVLFIENNFALFVIKFRTQFQNDITSYALFKDASNLLVNGIIKNGVFDKTEKHWTRWIRSLLTSWYLKDKHELNCDFVFLTQHYGLQIENLNNPVDVYRCRWNNVTK